MEVSYTPFPSFVFWSIWLRFISFTLDLIDFPSKREYDDYLELTADVIYSLTYGSRNEQQAARQRLADFQRVNRALIDKSKARKFQEKSEEERKERRKEGNHNNTQDKSERTTE